MRRAAEFGDGVLVPFTQIDAIGLDDQRQEFPFAYIRVARGILRCPHDDLRIIFGIEIIRVRQRTGIAIAIGVIGVMAGPIRKRKLPQLRIHRPADAPNTLRLRRP